MYCRHCGTELPDGANFCRNCGSEIKNKESIPASSPIVPPKKGQKKTGLIIVLSILGVLILSGIALALFFLPELLGMLNPGTGKETSDPSVLESFSQSKDYSETGTDPGAETFFPGVGGEISVPLSQEARYEGLWIGNLGTRITIRPDGTCFYQEPNSANPILKDGIETRYTVDNEKIDWVEVNGYHLYAEVLPRFGSVSFMRVESDTPGWNPEDFYKQATKPTLTGEEEKRVIRWQGLGILLPKEWEDLIDVDKTGDAISFSYEGFQLASISKEDPEYIYGGDISGGAEAGRRLADGRCISIFVPRYTYEWISDSLEYVPGLTPDVARDIIRIMSGKNWDFKRYRGILPDDDVSSYYSADIKEFLFAVDAVFEWFSVYTWEE